MTANSTTIRTATLDDLDAIMSIEKSSHSHPWAQSVMTGYLAKPGVISIIQLDKTPVGFAVVTRVVGEAELLDIAVHPDYQGKGLGEELMNHVLELASQDCERLFLEVRESNTPAIQLYEKLGFCQVGVRRNYYPSEKGREDALLYAQELML
ncbi:MAG: ribosomal protein S18-alanine N-acetyltransferase [Oceanobacter sp.]